ncbi:hypothetical protein MN116_004844 [Schistosoma mekongi]|uniref:Mediator of RNA polymerase II transcription subunit 25 von Willebrand factor type A domain-containing protein n=1 Tax=Schistosoma mekongi TaxID=38744 RepID=A0AAE2D4Y8_SCHME|nr:hypothetical protein MN116_004844 [Schistosoma mekongi]
MLNEIDVINTLPKCVNTIAHQTDGNCVKGTSGSSSPINFGVSQPHRPFSHPSHLCDKDVTSLYFLEDCEDTREVSNTRPSSTPASNRPIKHSLEKPTNFCPFPGLVRSLNLLCDRNSAVKKFESCQSNSPAPSTFTLPKEDSSVNLITNDLVCNPVSYETCDADSLFITKTLTSTAENYKVYDSEIPPTCDQIQSWDRMTTVRTGIKRPHSAALCYTHYSDTEDPLARPLSAPKRLIKEVHVPSNLNSNLASSDDTLVASVNFSNNNPDAPKSTLEALVASTSPLMFFPHEFSIDSECDDKFPEFVPQVSHGLMNQNIMNDLSFSIDLTSPNTEFSVRGETDLNAINTNSVSSSKSMTSLDLNDPNFKCPDSHGSQKSVYSDLGLITDVLENNMSAVTHMNEYVQAIRTYAAELCPVDCVILLEHCRPFNCDSIFMKYFRDQYLCPILSNLNGGPPLNADFGRDAYTSLYSLHGYCWRKPTQTTTLMSDTPIIYKILKRVATMQHESRHANDQINPSEGTPGHDLLQAAVREFDAIDRARRGLCRKVQRHLILLAMSPVDLSKLCQSDSPFMESGVDDPSFLEPLTNLKVRGVALSVFSPVQSPSLLKLYELVNGIPASPFYDRRWQTVALSDKLLQSDIPERRIIGPMAAAFHAQTEAELSILEHKQLPKEALTNGHSNKILGDSRPPSQSSAHTIDHSPNSRCVVTSNNKYPVQEQNLQQCTYGTEMPTFPVTSNLSLSVTTDASYHTNPSSVVGNSSSQYTNDGLSPMVVTQFCATASPVGSYQRPPRNPSVAASQYPPTTTPNYPSRTVCNSRVGADNNDNSNTSNIRSAEGIIPLANPLSVGHSGPNSVDQTPGSVYGSDSVATPQGTYIPQAGTISPLQAANSSHPMSQLHSPLSSGALHSHQPTPSTAQSSYSAYHHNPIHLYQNQQSFYDQNASRVMPGATAASPNSLQNSFRPPSNSASPSSQFIPTTVNTSGLSSPCSSRVPNKQYSPQLTPHPQQQGSPQNRLTFPGGTQKPIHSQFIRSGSSNQLSTSLTNQTNEIFATHSRSSTPTNTAYANNNSSINSSPLNINAQYVNYVPKDTLQQQQQSQQVQMKISSPQPSLCLLGGDGNLVQHSSNPPNQPSTISQQNYRRPHIPPNSNLSVHQSSQITQQQPQLCPTRSVFWEGEIHVTDSNGISLTNRLSIRLLLEQCAVRDMSQINLQMWGPVAQLSVIHAYRDSLLVERLSSPLGSGQLLARLLVELPDSNDASNLSSLLSTQSNNNNQLTIPLGILSPSSYRLSNPIQSGVVGFICMVYNPHRNRIHGLVPYDSEQFRQDIVMGRYFSNTKSNNTIADLNNIPSGNHFQRVLPNPQTFPQGHIDSQTTLMNINSQYMNTSSHMGNNTNIPPRDTSPCNSLNSTYQYQNQSHITQFMPQHGNSQVQNPAKSQTMGNTTAYQSVQLNQRSTPSPHNLQHDNLQTGGCISQYPLESKTSTQWITNRTDNSVSHQNQHLSISSNTTPNQSVRTLLSGQNSHMIQQPVPQRSSLSTGYSNTAAYHGHPHSRPNLDRHNTQAPIPVQSNPMTDPLVMMDQPSVHNSPLNNVFSHGQQQSSSHFIPSGSRIPNTVVPNPVNTYHRNNVPQNSGYSQPQSFNQRDHYLATQSQAHLSLGGNIGGGYACYQSRNTMVTNNLPNLSGHRFASGPVNAGSVQMPNQQSQVPKHQQLSTFSQLEGAGSRHGLFSHQSGHIHPGLSNVNSIDSIGLHYAIPSHDLPQHMMHSNVHGSLRQQPSYDSCGAGGNNSQGFF